MDFSFSPSSSRHVEAIPTKTILTPGEATTDVLNVAHSTWKANSDSNYTFEFEARAMPTGLGSPPAIVTVENNCVVRAVEIEEGETALGLWDEYEYGFPTIDQLFTWLENQSQDSNMVVAAVYDAAPGFPVQAYVRPKMGMIDLRFSIRKVTVR